MTVTLLTTLCVVVYFLIGLVIGWVSIKILIRNNSDFSDIPIGNYMISWPLLSIILVMLMIDYCLEKLDRFVRKH